jgi:hypothetical protein
LFEFIHMSIERKEPHKVLKIIFDVTYKGNSRRYILYLGRTHSTENPRRISAVRHMLASC